MSQLLGSAPSPGVWGVWTPRPGCCLDLVLWPVADFSQQQKRPGPGPPSQLRGPPSPTGGLRPTTRDPGSWPRARAARPSPRRNSAGQTKVCVSAGVPGSGARGCFVLSRSSSTLNSELCVSAPRPPQSGPFYPAPCTSKSHLLPVGGPGAFKLGTSVPGKASFLKGNAFHGLSWTCSLGRPSGSPVLGDVEWQPGGGVWTTV